MSLHFILGPSKSGKTTYAYDTMIDLSDRKLDESFLFVVPEQSTLTSQQALIKRHKKHVLVNLDVLGFTRLAHRVFEETGYNLPKVIDELGRIMLIRRALINVHDKLTVFKNSSNSAGFVEKIKATLTELAQYSPDTALLSSAVAGFEGRTQLKNKISDICVIEEEYKRLLGENKYITSENVLENFCKVIPESKMLKNSTIVIDSFNSFNTLNMRIITELLVNCRDVYIILNMTKSEYLKKPSDNELFAASRETISELSEINLKLNLKEAEFIWMDENKNYYRNDELFFVRQNYDHFISEQDRICAQNVCVMEADNPSDEIEKICGQISALIRRGYRYNDFAIISAAPDDYSSAIERIFATAGIPYFMDHRNDLSLTTPVRAITCAMNAVRDGFSLDSVIAYLRCGITDDFEAVDLIENYARCYGLKSRRRFMAQWTNVPDFLSDEAVKELLIKRDEMLLPLNRLNENFGRNTTVTQKVDALLSFMEETGLEGICEKKAELVKELRPDIALYYSQVLEQVNNTLEQIKNLCGEAVLSREDFDSILTEGLNSLKVGIIPPTLDRVVIGDLVRSRFADVRVLFVIGMNDGAFPVCATQDDILNDAERELLGKQNIKLKLTSRKANFSYSHFLYRAFTKPSEKLFLSYTKQNENGANMKPAYTLLRLLEMFSEVHKFNPSESIYSAKQGLMCLAQRKIEDALTRDGLMAFYASDDKYKGYLKLIENDVYLGVRKEQIDGSLVRDLYTKNNLTSVSRLERFAGCRMDYYLEYGLGLKPRKEFELLKVDVGNIYHRALELFFKNVITGKVSLGESDKLGELCDDCLGRAFEEFGNSLFEETYGNAFNKSRMSEIFKLNIEALINHIKAGKFLPKEVEKSFGVKGEKALIFEGTDIGLQGKIDRVDVSDKSIRIIDYKSGHKEFDFEQLYNGLQLQLFLYLKEVAGQNPEKSVTGAFYYHIDNPMPAVERKDLEGLSEKETGELIHKKKLEALLLKGSVNEEDIGEMDALLKAGEGSKVLKSLKLNNDGSVSTRNTNLLLKKEDINELCRLAADKAVSLIDQMLDGQVFLDPYKSGDRTACTYCSMKSVCGFNSELGCEYRQLETVNMTDYLSKMALTREENDEVDE